MLNTWGSLATLIRALSIFVAHILVQSVTTCLQSRALVPDRNLPALTTIFTYAPECRNRWILSPLATGPFRIFSVNPGTAATLADDKWSSCQPLKYQRAYSPGVCPEGDTLAVVSETQFVFGGSTAKQWEGRCCQRGFTGGGCMQTITTPVRVFAIFTPFYYTLTQTISSLSLVITSISPFEAYFYTSQIRVISGSSVSVSWTTLSNAITVTSAIASIEGIIVLWEVSDLPNFPPAYATSLAKRMGVPFTPTPSPGSSSSLVQQTSLPPQQPNSPPKVLSTAAKAGIGVGAVLGFLFLLSIGIVLLFVRRRRKRAVQSTQPATPELEDQDATLASRKWYLGGRWRSEAEVKTDPGELDSRAVHVVPGPPAELDGVERERDEQRINTTERERN